MILSIGFKVNVLFPLKVYISSLISGKASFGYRKLLGLKISYSSPTKAMNLRIRVGGKWKLPVSCSGLPLQSLRKSIPIKSRRKAKNFEKPRSAWRGRIKLKLRRFWPKCKVSEK